VTTTVADFKERFTEFSPTADALVSRALGEATRRTSAAVFGERFDDAVALRAAHLLAISPQGTTARLEGAAPGSLESTTYGAELKQLMRECAGGPHMVGAGAWGQ
jgi:hypothetical protein